MASTDVDTVKSDVRDELKSDKQPEEVAKQEPPTEQLQQLQIKEGSNNGATTTGENIDGILMAKHPLQYTWVLWYCKQDRSKPWEECLKEVATFRTVEDFWALYNHIQLASGLSWGSDYYLFKEGIQPMWEDKHNYEGGRWLFQVDKNRRNELLDQYWLELLMAVVGEQFDDHGDHVCGAVVNVRQKGDKVSLWTKDATNDDVNRRIGVVAKQKLGYTEQINFEQHKDTQQKNSSMVKPRLRV